MLIYMINNGEECSILLQIYIFCFAECLNTHANVLAVLSASARSYFTVPTCSQWITANLISILCTKYSDRQHFHQEPAIK